MFLSHHEETSYTQKKMVTWSKTYRLKALFLFQKCK